MTEKLIFPQQPILPVQPGKEKSRAKVEKEIKVPFNKVLEEHVQKGTLHFSNHAQQRLISRNIKLSPVDIQRINNAVEKAAEKGARDSLILMDDLAFVVSVKNKTVITAVDGEHLKENIFTNIDSAVII